MTAWHAHKRGRACTPTSQGPTSSSLGTDGQALKKNLTGNCYVSRDRNFTSTVSKVMRKVENIPNCLG